MQQQHVISEKKFRVEFFNTAAGEQPGAVIDIFEEIGDWWGYGVNRLAYALHGHTGPIRVRVNSYGGDLLQGVAIMNLLRSYPGEVTAEVIGIAASAATFVVAGAEKVVMREGSFLMVHNPFTLAIGTADEMKSTADALAKMEQEMANIYLSGMRKRKKYDDLTDEKAIAKIRDWMNAETWFTSEEAVEHGFADEVDGDSKADVDTAIQSAAAAASDPEKQYKNTPIRVLNLISADTKKTNTMAEKSILDKIMDLLNPPAVEDEAEQSEEVEKETEASEDDKIEAARKALEDAGYTVSKEEKDGKKETEMEGAEKTYTEAEVEAMLAKAIEAASARKAAAKNPIVPKAGGSQKTNRIDALRTRAIPAFDALATMVKAR